MKQAILIFTLVLLVAGCSSPTVDPATPPAIVYGEDVCDRCGMIIEDDRFAAGLVVEVADSQYEHRIFDDIGDMLAYTVDEGAGSTIHAYYVHDYESKAWLDGESAVYVRSNQIHSPMGHGLAAFETRPAAEAQALVWGGEVFEFTQLQTGIGE